MKTKLSLTIILSGMLLNEAISQNYIDKYLTDSLTYTTIGTSSNGVKEPRDLDFKPNSNELWVINNRPNSGSGSNGGSTVTFYNAGESNQYSQYKKDSHTGHFMIYPSALAFGDNGDWATVQEIKNTASASSTFMGPALWSSDTMIFAKVFQNDWVGDKPLGSHLDMLHQSPYAMGIAHDSADAYWVFDGHNGNICKYAFNVDHSPGYDDHSDGKIWRYTDVTVSRVPNVPSHMVLDKTSGWLYFIDGGSKKLKRMNTNTGTITGTLTVPSTSQEGLGGYWKVQNSIVETVDSFTTQPCGIDFYNDRLIVGDYTNGNIYIYRTDTLTLPLKLDTLATGQNGMMGIKIGNDGKIWFVNNTQQKVYRIDPLRTTVDASVLKITAPTLTNYEPHFYATKGYNECNPSITPMVTLRNEGTNALTSVTISYILDGDTTDYNWTGSLASGASASVTLPSKTLVNGNYKLTAYTHNPNGVPDMNPINDAKDGSFRVLDPVSSFPFSEDFSGSTFPSSGWYYIHHNPNNDLSRISNIGGFGTNTGCIKMDNYSGSQDIAGQTDYLMTPRINLSTAPAIFSMEFSVAYAQYNSSTNDNLKVFVSKDCGDTWTSVYNKSGNNLSTASAITTAFTPSASQWRKEIISLNSYSGEANVMFMFVLTSAYGNNLYIDDIKVVEGNSSSIEENELSKNLTIYPNPSNGNISIELQNGTPAKVNIEIWNITGQMIEQRKDVLLSDNTSYKLEINNVSSTGTYFVRIHNEEKSYIKKIDIIK